MRSVFADTFYFLALLDSREKFHLEASMAFRDPSFRFVLTEWVLTEFGDAYSRPEDRADFVAIYRSIVDHPRFKIVAANSDLFRRGIELFEQRPDKERSLTDCLSFVVMHDEGITEALTGDRHFEQTGFVALLK